MRTFILNVSVCCYLILFINAVLPAEQFAPSFALFSTEGELVTLSSKIRDRDLLVIFFASYCAPCREELPRLIGIHKKNPDKFNVLLVNIDKEGKQKAEETMNEIGISGYICLLDIYQQTIKKYSPALTVPAFFLIDKSGRIKFASTGYRAESISLFEKNIDK